MSLQLFTGVIIVRIFIFCCFLLSFAAHSAIPEKGMWWNPAESGRGYGIDVQDNLVFVTYYGYRDNGTSTFFTSLGVIDPATSEVAADWVSFRGGQCWGCSYSAPVATVIGTARFKFDTPLTGSIKLNSGLVIPIQRQSAIEFDSANALLGTWQMTYGALGIYYGDILWAKKIENAAEKTFSGIRLGATASRIFVGKISESDVNSASILVDSSASYYTFYYFSRGFDGIVGKSWTYLKTSSLSGTGLTLFGNQLLGKNMSDSVYKANGDSFPNEVEGSVVGHSFDVNLSADEDVFFQHLSTRGGGGEVFRINDVEFEVEDMARTAKDLEYHLLSMPRER